MCACMLVNTHVCMNRDGLGVRLSSTGYWEDGFRRPSWALRGLEASGLPFLGLAPDARPYARDRLVCFCSL